MTIASIGISIFLALFNFKQTQFFCGENMKKGSLVFVVILLFMASCAPAKVERVPSPNISEAASVGSLPAENAGLIKASELIPLLGASTLTLIDVRSAEELAETGIIEGAIHIPIESLPDRLNELPGKGSSLVVYCRSGNRAAAAQEILIAQGYSDVLNLEGGIANWLSEGYQLLGTDQSNAQLPEKSDCSSGVGPDKNLSHCSFAGLDLAGMDLSGSDLSYSDFSHADLSKAILVGVNLTGANFNSANLQNADFTNANFKNVDLSQSDMMNAIISDAQLELAFSTLGAVMPSCDVD